MSSFIHGSPQNIAASWFEFKLWSIYSDQMANCNWQHSFFLRSAIPGCKHAYALANFNAASTLRYTRLHHQAIYLLDSLRSRFFNFVPFAEGSSVSSTEECTVLDSKLGSLRLFVIAVPRKAKSSESNELQYAFFMTTWSFKYQTITANLS